MPTCKKCQRPLEANEKGLCPACRSTKSSKAKRMVEIGAAAVVILVGAVAWVFGRRHA